VAAGLAVFLTGMPPWTLLAAAVVMTPAGIWSAGRTAMQIGEDDPHVVVVDEVLGQWITLAGATHWDWRVWPAAFFLFRLLDIWKPAPVRQLERLPAGYGIVADDLMAGAYGALVMYSAGCFNLY
jgi:phosphatidylglycerophosphatase A